MNGYALIINGDKPSLYVELERKLHTNDEIEIKRNEVKFWLKELNIVNTFFLKKGVSEIQRDRNVNNYRVRLKIGSETGSRCLENSDKTYIGFTASII